VRKRTYISWRRRIPLDILFVVMFFIAGEVAIAKVSDLVIKQRVNLITFDKTCRDKNVDVVAIGNSSVEVGVNTVLLSDILSKQFSKGQIGCFNLGVGALPAGVEYFIFKNIISPRKPSTVIVGFSGDGLKSPDIQSFDTYHMLRDYVRFEDIPVLFRISYLDFNTRSDFILRKVSYTYSYRYIIQFGVKLVLKELFVNHRRPVTLIANRVRRLRSLDGNAGFRPISEIKEIVKKEKGDSGEFYEQDELMVKAPQENDYYYLTAMIDLAEKRGISLLFIAMPVEQKYHVSDRVKTILSDNGIKMLDFSNSRKYDKYFLDEEHLNAEGAALFTKDIADYLRKDVPKDEGKKLDRI